MRLQNCWFFVQASKAVSALMASVVLCGAAFGGGPKYVSGATYFDPSVKGTAIQWTQGEIYYYTDQGDLSPYAPHADADAFVNAAFAQWMSVMTAAISPRRAGALSEDVNGTNVYANPDHTITMPADIQSTASDKPLAIVYDYDGAVTDAFLGSGASQKSLCPSNSVFGGPDSFATGGYILHALVVMNGNCMPGSDDPDMKYHLVRVLGQVLGLDWSQANLNAVTGNPIPTLEDILGLPVMHFTDFVGCVPVVLCYPGSDPSAPKIDDQAALSRLYPVTTDNHDRYPNKQLFHETTARIYGSLRFADPSKNSPQAMQGVNVVARWIDTGTGMPSARYVVTSVSGFLYRGNAGNPVNGYVDVLGQRYDRFGSDDPSLEGYFDLSGLPLPQGDTAQYQLSIESVDPQWSQDVGPYGPWQVTASGNVVPVIVTVTRGGEVQQDLTMLGSAIETLDWGEPSSYAVPAPLPPAGDWLGGLETYGNTDYFQLTGRANRTMSVTVTALDETSATTLNKIRPIIGMWALSDPPGTLAGAQTSSPFNTSVVAESRLDAKLLQNTTFRIGITDQRGDGRPDYRYHAQVLYADSVAPERVSAQTGAAIVIKGIGFRPDLTAVAGLSLPVFAAGANQLVITAPGGVIDGTQTLTISDPETGASTSMIDALTFGAVASDTFRLLQGWNPATPVGSETTNAIRVGTTSASGQPVNGATIALSASSGATLSACGGASACVVYSDAAGEVSTRATVNAPGTITITATLAPYTPGIMKTVTATVLGTESALDLALVSQYRYVASGTSAAVALTARVLGSGSPLSGRSVNFQVVKGSGSLNPATAVTNSSGFATSTLQVSSIAGDVWVSACVAPSNSPCQTFYLTAVPQSSLRLQAVSGGGQIVPVGQAFQPLAVRVTDSATPSNPVQAVNVVFQQTVFRPDADAPIEVVGESKSGNYPERVILASSQQALTTNADGYAAITPSAAGITDAVEIETTAYAGNMSLLFEVESMWGLLQGLEFAPLMPNREPKSNDSTESENLDPIHDRRSEQR